MPGAVFSGTALVAAALTLAAASLTLADLVNRPSARDSHAAHRAPSLGGGAAWTGDMHPSIGLGSNPACNMSTLVDCAPTYAQLKAAGRLWRCPDGVPTKQTCAAGPGRPTCTKSKAGGDNPLCSGQLTDENPCCCPRDGCYTEALYNTVIGVCRGTGCQCGDNTQASCGPQGDTTKCGSYQGQSCTGPAVRCCFGSNVQELVKFYNLGTQAVVNYWAAYQFDASARQWVIQADSSFNTDGKFPPHNLTAKDGGIGDKAWLAPQPGGSAFWSAGYYPAGVKGVGPPGAMFVLSTEQFWGATWYMLNQLTLDRGPASGYPADDCKVTNDNCWAAGNAGEMDFLETGWNLGNISGDPLYQRSFSTQFNQVGRCFNGGVNGGGFRSKNFLLTSPPPFSGEKPEPIVFVAVVDSVGTWVYRLPADRADKIWPGIGRKTIEAKLQAAPAETAPQVNPCTTDYCLVFTSNCQATNVSAARSQQCGFNGDQGWCGNVFSEMVATGQPLVPNASCVRDVRGGQVMPWCAEMVKE